MNTNDQQHIEAICRRNNIHLITKEEHDLSATAMLNLGHPTTKRDVSCNAQRLNSDGTRTWGIYLGKDSVNGHQKTDEEDYFSALHEIGHCMMGHGLEQGPMFNDNNSNESVEHEIQAWEWAYAHAQYWPSDETLLWTLGCLASYTDYTEGGPFYQPKQQQEEKPNMKIDEKITQALSKNGFTEKQAENIQNNLNTLGIILSVLDKGLLDMDVKSVRTLANVVSAAVKSGSLNSDTMDNTAAKMHMLADLAEQYQNRFGEAELPQVNVFSPKVGTA